MNKNLTFKKDGIIFDVTTRAENVSFNTSNVKEEIDRINKKIDSIPATGDGEIIIDNSEHNDSKINSENGVHGLRYFENKFSVKEDDEWIDVINKSEGVSGGSSITLPATKFIEITSNEISVIIKWEDADDQILNGATISTWAGTKLIKKIDSPPSSELDGEILLDNTERDLYKLNGFIDADIEIGKVYYYALFPYNAEGTYNYDVSNIRKFYKSSEAVPENTTDIKVTPARHSIQLNWADGISTSDALWAGTKIVRKAGSPPLTEIDGVLILDNVNRNKYRVNYFTDDTATQDVEYFYGFFPYSREGHYNTNIENVASAMPSTGKIYTLSIDMTNTLPSDACSYLDDAVDMQIGEVWDETDIFQARPCLLRGGKVNYYLNKNDYTQKIDGTPSNLTGIDGDVMIEIPFICFKVSISGDILKISLSGDKQLIKSNIGYKCYPFYDKDGNIADKIYVGAYQASIDSDNLYTISDKEFTVDEKYSLEKIFNACKSRGSYYLPYSYSIHQLLIFLYMMRFKTRSYVEYLSTDVKSYANVTGTLNKKGMWYKGDTGKWLGIEWGTTNFDLFLSGVLSLWVGSLSNASRDLALMFPKDYLALPTLPTEYIHRSFLEYADSNNTTLKGAVRTMRVLMNHIFPNSLTGGTSVYFVASSSYSRYDFGATRLFFIKNDTTPYKSPMNFFDGELNLLRTNYATYLTYIKGEKEK